MNCVVCEDVITNPMCPCCLHKGVAQWLHEKGCVHLAAQIAVPVLPGKTSCIGCGRGMSVCSYCYTGDVFDIIKASPELIGEFLAFFNFDLGHLGWEQEARAYLGE